MKRIPYVLIASLGLAVASRAAVAQTAAASAPMASASIPRDCKPKHDHGAERGMPTGASANCAKGATSAEDAASAPAKKQVKPHDHAKFHKNQG